MHSARAWLAALALGCALGTGVRAQHEPHGPAPTRAQVQSAAQQVAQDPNLPAMVKEKTLRFKRGDEKAAAPGGGQLGWLADALRWLAETGRLLMWLAGMIALALVLVGLRHWLRIRPKSHLPKSGELPSHVQSLDIRPESLPDDVGRAAAALWQRGEHRAALSLLYRGTLSRLVHEFAVPIRAAATEGECVVLAHRALDAERGDFVARLVAAWQLAVYGARLPSDAQALALCDDFDLHLRADAKALP